MIIYLITNILNGKRYVGQTTRTLEQRIKEHQLQHSDVGNAINQCGIENFRFEVLETCSTIEQLNEREMFWISKLNCIAPNGYNRNEGGRNFIRIPHEKSAITESPFEERMTVAESLKRFRKHFGLTQQQVADQLGISRQLYFAYENNSVPSAETIKKLAVAYSVSTDYLVGIVDEPNGNNTAADTVDVVKISVEDFNSLTVSAKAFADAFLDISAKQNTSTADSQ